MFISVTREWKTGILPCGLSSFRLSIHCRARRTANSVHSHKLHIAAKRTLAVRHRERWPFTLYERAQYRPSIVAHVETDFPVPASESTTTTAGAWLSMEDNDLVAVSDNIQHESSSAITVLTSRFIIIIIISSISGWLIHHVERASRAGH